VAEGRELEGPDGGSISELASYPLTAVVKLLGTGYTGVTTSSLRPEDSEVETFSRIDLTYPHAVASARVGLGVKAEGDLVVAGTKGYIYVPAPWWKTEYFEARFEDQRDNKKYYYKFDGDGLRYEVAEFASLIRNETPESFKLRAVESITMAGIIEDARRDATVIR
jgi:predicted dehydrogenase